MPSKEWTAVIVTCCDAKFYERYLISRFLPFLPWRKDSTKTHKPKSTGLPHAHQKVDEAKSWTGSENPKTLGNNNQWLHDFMTCERQPKHVKQKTLQNSNILKTLAGLWLSSLAPSTKDWSARNFITLEVFQVETNSPRCSKVTNSYGKTCWIPCHQIRIL